MRLASPKKVLERMGATGSTTGQASASAVSALEAATIILENQIGTTFTRETKEDFFSPVESRYTEFSTKPRLYLSKGYVDSAQTFQVYMSSVAMQATTDGSLVDPSDYLVNYERGVVDMQINVYKGGRTLLVTYTAGFNAQAVPLNDEYSLPYKNHPLEEMSISQAIRILWSHSQFKNKKSSLDAAGELELSLSQMMNPHIRPRMRGLIPVFSKTITV